MAIQLLDVSLLAFGVGVGFFILLLGFLNSKIWAIFIHFAATAWAASWIQFTSKLSASIALSIVYNSPSFVFQTISNQPSILAFVFIVFLGMVGILKGISEYYPNRPNGESGNRIKSITRRNPNRGL